MIETKHTPGPWEQDRDGAICMRGQRCILPTAAGPDGASFTERGANLRLIAAAPDLLEASAAVAAFIGGPKDRFGRPEPTANDDMRAARERIREMAVQHGVAGGHHTYLDQCAALLNAVVAKATGEAQ